MNSSTILLIAGFFFILGAGIIGLIWIIITLVRGNQSKANGSSSSDPAISVLASLLRDVKTQDLVVEMDGKRFKSVSELSPTQQRRLGFTASVLAKWLAQSTSPVDATSSDVALPAAGSETTEQSVPVVAFEPSATAVAAGEPLPAAQTDSLAGETPPGLSDWIPAEAVPTETIDHHTPPFSVEPSSEVKPVSTSLTDVVAGILNPTPAPTPVYKSIAMQIDDILQARISGTRFEGRGIAINDGPDHGVLVILDGQKYPGIKDVPDEAVRDLIRSSVLEWEKQSKASSK